MSIATVTLKQRNMSVLCDIIHDGVAAKLDIQDFEMDSLSMRGAQREITGLLLKRGYSPAGRWIPIPDKMDIAAARYFRAP